MSAGGSGPGLEPLRLTTKQIKVRAAGVTNYIQAGGDRNLLLPAGGRQQEPGTKGKGYEAGANLTPAEVEIAGKVKQTFADYLVKLRGREWRWRNLRTT